MSGLSTYCQLDYDEITVIIEFLLKFLLEYCQLDQDEAVGFVVLSEIVVRIKVLILCYY